MSHTLTWMTGKKLWVSVHHQEADFCCSKLFGRVRSWGLNFCKPTLFSSLASTSSWRHLYNHKFPRSLHWYEHWQALCPDHLLKNLRQAMQWRLLVPSLWLLLVQGVFRQPIFLISLPSILLIVYYKHSVYNSSQDNQFKVRHHFNHGTQLHEQSPSWRIQLRQLPQKQSYWGKPSCRQETQIHKNRNHHLWVCLQCK